MKPSIILALVVLLFPIYSAKAEVREIVNFRVDAAASVGSGPFSTHVQAWRNTGIWVESGDIVELQAGGLAWVAPPFTAERSRGPDGYGGLYCAFWDGIEHCLADVPYGQAALVGKIGEDLGDEFLVGSAFSGTANDSGFLYLAFNDNYYNDNSGFFLVTGNVSAPEEAASEYFQITVDARVPWEDTGIYVNEGEHLSSEASGLIANALAQQLYIDPDGGPGAGTTGSSYMVPTLQRYGLIGKLGTDGTPFFVGSFLDMVATSSGNLYISANDQPGLFGDNSGFWTVDLWISQVPEGCPAPIETILEVEKIVEVEVPVYIEVEKVVAVEVPGPERIVEVEVEKIVEVEVPAEYTVESALAFLEAHRAGARAARKAARAARRAARLEAHDNRSGHGDDTNPGRGNGRGHSPNKGSENPHRR